jgi:hypothetical protein
MDSTDLSNLVGRLERQSDHAPRIYAAKVAVVAALGYVCVALVAIVILVSACFAIASLLSQGRPYIFSLVGLIGGGALLVAVVRALLVRVEEPVGREISREEAPALFAALDEVIQKMAVAALKKVKSRTRGVSFDTVRLTREFSASICQIPRWGVFGNYRNHLQIGVPAMAALNIAEFKAVLAHEIGHLGREHDRFSACIYRQRTTWQLLQRKFEAPATLVDHALAAFYRWYAPYFHAYTFVLARNHEYAADRAAAQATHARVLARALTKLELVSRFLSEVFWKRLFDQVEKVPEPRYLPYAMMPRAFDVAQKEWLRKDWLQDSLRTFATDGDTHPSLADRLAALDVPPELPSHSPDASALALLGTNQVAVLKWCDTQWEQENVAAWRKRHDAIREARWKLAQYENTPAAELQAEGIWEKSILLLDLGQDHDAIEVLQELVARGDALPKAHLQLGRLLLEYGDEHGLQNLTLAGQQDPELLEAAGQAGYGYLMDRGRRGEAQRFWQRLQAG